MDVKKRYELAKMQYDAVVSCLDPSDSRRVAEVTADIHEMTHKVNRAEAMMALSMAMGALCEELADDTDGPLGDEGLDKDERIDLFITVMAMLAKNTANVLPETETAYEH